MARKVSFDTLKRLIKWRAPDQKGQSIVIITFAFLGLIAMLGLALDLGLVYVEQTRVKRAVDAAALAGVADLPHEEESMLRAINYLDENGYRMWNASRTEALVRVYVRGCTHESYLATASPYDNWHEGNTPSTPMNTASIDTGKEYYQYFPPPGIPLSADSNTEFFIDTYDYQQEDGIRDPDDTAYCDPTDRLYGTSTKLRVEGRVFVDMNFMQFFGFDEVAVSDFSIAQNVSSLDVAIVFDVSGSMQFDTVCHGCYEPYGNGDVAWQDLEGNDPNYDASDPVFPNPAYYRPVMTAHLPALPVATGGVAGVGSNLGQLCNGRDGNPTEYYKLVSGSLESYIIMEAELYSRKVNSFYQSRFRSPGQGFWAVQHTNYRTIYRMEDEQNGNVSNPYATDLDRTYEVGATPIQPSYPIGSWVSHQPYVSWAIDPNPSANPPVDGVPFGKDYTLLDAQSDTSPSLEYNFVTSPDWFDNGGQTQIFVRMQGAGETFGFADSDAEGVGRVYWTLLDESGTQILPNVYTSPRAPEGPTYGGADANGWDWLEFAVDPGDPAPILQSDTKYILKIWAGGVGVDLDRIVIGNGDEPVSRDLAREPTAGSAFGEACNRCNPIYGQTIGSFDECDVPSDNGYVAPENLDMTQDELYSDYQPLRDAKEATKRFITKLNPRFDQVGFVPYSTDTIDDGIMEMQCYRYGQDHNEDCFDGTSPISYTRVLDVVERVPAIGSTNMGAGLRDGLQVLGVDVEGLGASFDNDCLASGGDPTIGSHCGRSGTNRIIIVMTDGVPTNSPAGCGSGSGYAKHRSCTIFYTQKAADSGVTVYTIGLGNGVDGGLLTEMAEIGEGQYYNVLNPSRLDEVFDEILDNIVIRLVE